jgi:hypothetical protein
MSREEKDINEMLSYRVKCNQWKELKIYGDITALQQITQVSSKTISKAVNKGVGSLKLLRTIDKYYERRAEKMGNVQYFSGSKNPII